MNTHISLFLFILTNFIFELVFSDYQQQLQNYRGNEIYSGKEDTIMGNLPNYCQCDIEPNSCQYLCSCDDNCPENIALSWKERNQYTNEKEDNKTYSDRCIDKHLLFKLNIRRGLRMEIQTEDISKYENRTIENFCYSIDNSKKSTNNIQSLGEIENYQKNKGTILNNIVAYLIGNENNIQGGNDNDNDNGNEETKNTLKYIKSSSSSGPFYDNGFFTLYSGSKCDNKERVEYFIPRNYSCLQAPSEVTYKSISNGIQIGDKNNCEIKDRYIVNEDGLLNYKSNDVNCGDNYNILEVEFVLKMASYQNISYCYINIVCKSNTNPINSKFKNSIIFSHSDSIHNISYRYSGYGGYLNDYPLKITDNNFVYNEFYIVGRYTNGDCRYFDTQKEEEINNYLYYYDLPIYFNKNYAYLCKNDKKKSIYDTILFKKVNKIEKIAKYGASSYNNINNSEDWISVQKYNKSNDDKYNSTILMNITIRTKKIGKYSHKYISNVTMEVYYDDNDNEKKGTYMFKLQYIDYSLNEEDSETIYNKSPPYPTFVPKIPDDILDPLINSDVDK